MVPFQTNACKTVILKDLNMEQTKIMSIDGIKPFSRILLRDN